MKKSIIRFTLFLVIFLACAAFFKAAPIVYDGYIMYQTAVKQDSLEEKVLELKQNENYIPLEDISKDFLNALVKSEDVRFFLHPGVDPISLLRAVITNIKDGEFSEGGSTITQQLSKNLYFSFDKKLERKVAEVLVAFTLEINYTKEEILEMYCNIIYFGQDCYGIKEAAKHYYNTTPMELNEGQISALVKTIKRPNDYNPNVLTSP